MKRRPRSAPSYLTRDEERGAFDLRFRYVDSIGRVHWPRERSPYPADLARSRQWAAWRRAEIVREIEAEIVRVEAERAAPVTLGDVLDAYAADCRERGTAWSREAARARIIRKTLGAATPAAELTAGRIAAWRSELRAHRKLAPRSANAYVNIVRAALNLAVERGVLADNPMSGLRNLPEPLREPPALSERQVGALLAACRVWRRYERLPRPDLRRRYLPIATRVLIGYYTGGRPESIDALTWRDVDLERGVIVFPSSKRRRVVCPLEPELVAHLREERARRRPEPGELVLPAPRSGRAAVNWRPPWSRVLALANRRLEPDEQIPPETPLHALRHSRITHLLVAGLAAQVVAQITGTSLAMLQRHYAHVMVAGLERELERARAHPALAGLAAFAHGQNGRRKTALPLRQPRDGAFRKSHRIKLVG